MAVRVDRIIFSMIVCFALLCAGAAAGERHSAASLRGRVSAAKKALAARKVPPYAPDEVLVRFRPAAGIRAAAAAAAKALGSGVPSRVKQKLKSIDVYHLKITDPNITVEEALARLRSNPDVERAEPNYIRHIAVNPPNDTDFGQLWGMDNIGQVVNGSAGTNDADMDLPEAWDITTGAANVVIAVIDSGVAYDHPDLAANIWANAGETSCIDGIDNDGNGYIDDCRGWDFVDSDNDPMDYNNHGTHVSGTIAAVGNNALGVAGVNWTAKIMPVRGLDTLGYGWDSDLIAAIEYANDNGADVINNSWGSSTSYVITSSFLKDAIDRSPAVVVCAAGNEYSEIQSTTVPYYLFYPASYSSSNIISVAASDQSDDLAWFSNYGYWYVDLAAPGMNIYSTVPARETILPPGSGNFDGVVPPALPAGWSDGQDAASPASTWATTAELSSSTPNSLSDSPGANYVEGSSTWAQTPVINLTGKQGCKLSYEIEVDLSTGDYLCIVATKDASAPIPTWDTPLGGSCWSGSFPGFFIPWEEDLKDYDNLAAVAVRFWLTSDSNATTVASGVHIDNVEVTCASSAYAGTEYDYYDGTSMAAPHVSGLAGLIKALYPGLTNIQIKDLIVNSAEPKFSFSGLVSSGGRANAYNAFLLPAAPSSLSAAARGSSHVDLVWTDNAANEEGFKIERRRGAGAYTQIATVDADYSNYTDSGLQFNTTYTYRIRAYNANGDGPYSNEATATTGAGFITGAISDDNSNCFIATAAYGSYLDPHVAALRRFRDRHLLTNALGRNFVALYYRVSPQIADVIRQHEFLRFAARMTLTPVIYSIEYPLPAFAMLLLVAGGVGYGFRIRRRTRPA